MMEDDLPLTLQAREFLSSLRQTGYTLDVNPIEKDYGNTLEMGK